MATTENDNGQGQNTHFYILTLDLPGRQQASWVGELIVRPGTRRKEVYDYLRDQIAQQYPAMERANPIYFALDPITL
ncbi:hypothetical protein [Streptomyces sp. NPDC127098]|uniref:hypothetical protein n=1 Tax=Streptomyces sp. NPDC127098 TaxID=3347137 RepID=UPI003653BC79